MTFACQSTASRKGFSWPHSTIPGMNLEGCPVLGQEDEYRCQTALLGAKSLVATMSCQSPCVLLPEPLLAEMGSPQVFLSNKSSSTLSWLLPAVRAGFSEPGSPQPLCFLRFIFSKRVYTAAVAGPPGADLGAVPSLLSSGFLGRNVSHSLCVCKKRDRVSD